MRSKMRLCYSLPRRRVLAKLASASTFLDTPPDRETSGAVRAQYFIRCQFDVRRAFTSDNQIFRQTQALVGNELPVQFTVGQDVKVVE